MFLTRHEATRRGCVADLLGLAFVASRAAQDGKQAEKTYAGKEFPLSGTATLAVGSGNETAVLVGNAAKITVRLGTDRRPARFPAKFTAAVKYKDFFAPAKELSLTASKIEYK